MGAAIAAWTVTAAATRVYYGGRWNNNDGPFAGGRTYLIDYNPYRIRQDGFIRRAEIYVQANAGGTWKLKVFRKNGATFDFVGESNGFIPANLDVIQTFNFNVPVACEVGDYIALHVPAGGALFGSNIAGASNRYVAGDISASNAFALTDTASYLGVKVFGTAPFMVGSGDSIMVGHTLYNGMHDGAAVAFTGDRNADPANVLQSLIPAISYQNQAWGGQTWSYMAVDQLAEMQTLAPALIWYHCGVNDAATSRTWAAVQADLDIIRAAFPATELVMSEVLPWTLGSDATAGRIRALNANYAVWCPANDVKLILCHDDMAQLRVSTGQLDDVKAAYLEDGDIHLSLAGVARLVALANPVIQSAFG